MVSNLKHKTAVGLFWSFTGSFGVYFLKFGFSISIARLLSPEDYGLVGMVAIFIAVSTMLTESGFRMSLIQKKDANQVDYSTIFYFSLFAGILLYFLIFFAAGIISDFYEQPSLKSIIRILSINIIFSSLQIIPYTLFNKDFNFKKLTIFDFVSSAVSGAIGLYFAYKGFAVWALVIMLLSNSFILLTLLWLFVRWHPNLIFSLQSFKQLYSFGYKIFLQALTDTIFRNIYYPIIGKYFSLIDLGFYTKAVRFNKLFVRQFSISFSKVIFPAFSIIQEDFNKIQSNYIKGIRLLSYVAFPFTIILIISAEGFVTIFLTEKWLPSVPFIEIFFLEGLFFPFFVLNLIVLNARGKSGTTLKINIIKRILFLISIIIFFRFGIIGLIAGQIISSFIAFVIGAYLVAREVQLSIVKQFTLLFPNAILITIITLIFYISSNIFITNIILKLVFNISSISLSFHYISKLLRTEGYVDFVGILKNVLPKRIVYFL